MRLQRIKVRGELEEGMEVRVPVLHRALGAYVQGIVTAIAIDPWVGIVSFVVQEGDVTHQVEVESDGYTVDEVIR